MAQADTTPPPSPPPTLRRRNSLPTSVVIPTKLTLPSKPLHTASLPPAPTNGTVSPPPLDFELLSLKPTLSYTSLKDLLPSTAVNSPTSAVTPSAYGGSAYEISIHNRLVKQAAWAYLQPMSPLTPLATTSSAVSGSDSVRATPSWIASGLSASTSSPQSPEPLIGSSAPSGFERVNSNYCRFLCFIVLEFQQLKLW